MIKSVFRFYILLFAFIIIRLETEIFTMFPPKETTEIENYQKVWMIPERDVFLAGNDNKPLLTFPEDISDLNVTDFCCYYDKPVVGQVGFQIHLSIEYDKEEYANEINRLKNVKAIHSIRYDSENLSDSAYVAAWNWWDSYEYAICHDSNNIIDYIYIQAVVPPDAKLHESLLPNNFKNGYEEYLDSDEYMNVGEYIGDWLGFDSFTIYE